MVNLSCFSPRNDEWDFRYDIMVDQLERLAVAFMFRLLNKDATAAIFKYRIGRASLNSMSSLTDIGRNDFI